MDQCWLSNPYSLEGKRIWVAGHNGMVGSALMRQLADVECEVISADRRELDLRDQLKVKQWLGDHKPEAVILAAARVGGIGANDTYPAEFFYDNTMISTNVIHGSYEAGVERLLFLGSSCIYPRDCPQPIKEEYLLSGSLEPTNEAYALAKIGALKMVQFYRRQYGCDFVSAMPCNLYGVGDRYDAEQSHVIPSLILKMHKAKVNNDQNVSIWGSGTPLREFLYVDDLAQALIYILRYYSGLSHINVGSGEEVSIKKLAETVCQATDFKGNIVFDHSKKDGTPRKVLDSGLLKRVGWKPEMCLKDGINKCYADFKGRYDNEGDAEYCTDRSGRRSEKQVKAVCQ